jgi:uncharacterized protein (DUF433 family)
MSQPARIINRGRGPEIAGTRITVYNVLDYLRDGWEPTRIAKLFQVSLDQVRVAEQYIAEHADEVMPAYERILARDAQGNSPELHSKLESARAKLRAMVHQRQEANGQGQVHVGDSA